MSPGEVQPNSTILAAMTDLWRLRPPGPDNIFAHPTFEPLRDACRDSYSNAGRSAP